MGTLFSQKQHEIRMRLWKDVQTNCYDICVSSNAEGCVGSELIDKLLYDIL